MPVFLFSLTGRMWSKFLFSIPPVEIIQKRAPGFIVLTRNLSESINHYSMPVKKGYLLYKTVAEEPGRKTSFMYIERIYNYRFLYSPAIARAKRFSLARAIFLSALCRMSFVSEKVVIIYR